MKKDAYIYAWKEPQETTITAFELGGWMADPMTRVREKDTDLILEVSSILFES